MIQGSSEAVILNKPKTLEPITEGYQYVLSSAQIILKLNHSVASSWLNLPENEFPIYKIGRKVNLMRSIHHERADI